MQRKKEKEKGVKKIEKKRGRKWQGDKERGRQGKKDNRKKSRIGFTNKGEEN